MIRMNVRFMAYPLRRRTLTRSRGPLQPAMGSEVHAAGSIVCGSALSGGAACAPPAAGRSTDVVTSPPFEDKIYAGGAADNGADG